MPALTIRQKRAAAAAAAVGAGLFALSLYSRPPSADDVARLSMRAFERGDVNTLLELTLPEERQRLNLTPVNVRNFLLQTLWSKGFPEHLQMQRLESPIVDEVLYAVQPPTDQSKGLNYPLYLMVNNSPHQGWRLALSFTLFESAAVREVPQDSTSVTTTFAEYARRCGIRGKRTNTAGYTMLDEPRL